MNTNQLTVLWYGVAVLTTVQVGVGWESNNPVWYLTAFVSGVALLIYTLKPPKNAHPRALWLRFALPVGVIVGVSAGVGWWNESHVQHTIRPSATNPEFSPIPVDEVELTDAHLEDWGRVSGWLKNNSTRPVHAVDLGILVFNARGDLIGSERLMISVEILPERSARVEAYTKASPHGLGAGSEKWSWQTRVLAVGSRGDPSKP